MIWWLATALAAPLAPGDILEETLESLDGETIAIPDPDGRTVVLELIRSPDW